VAGRLASEGGAARQQEERPLQRRRLHPARGDKRRRHLGERQLRRHHAYRAAGRVVTCEAVAAKRGAKLAAAAAAAAVGAPRGEGTAYTPAGRGDE
jgi:hypothetical protein